MSVWEKLAASCFVEWHIDLITSIERRRRWAQEKMAAHTGAFRRSRDQLASMCANFAPATDPEPTFINSAHLGRFAERMPVGNVSSNRPWNGTLPYR